MFYYSTWFILIPLFSLCLYFKFKKIFYIISVLYPIIATLALINSKDQILIKMYENNFIVNFSSENKLIALAFMIVVLTTNLYAISQNRKLEVLIGNLYSSASLICLFAGDFILMFIAIEIMMILATLLIFYGNYRDSIKAARQYLLTHLISGIFILIGISYIITHTSSSQIISLTQFIENRDAACIFYILILCGCLINVASLPFCGWIVNCYPFASSSGLMYLTSFTSKISIIVLLKLFSGLVILKFFGLLMIIYGVVYACIEDNIKRLICYLTISQLGFMLIAIGTKSQQANLAIIVFIFVHILYKALFNLYVAILIDKEHIENCSEIKRIYSLESPLLCCSLIVSVLFTIALPPFASFVTAIVVNNALEQDISYYAIFLLKIITCVALFSTVKYKYIIEDFHHRLNILSRFSLLVMLSCILVTSFFLKEGFKLVGFTKKIDISWLDLIKQILIIVIGIILALVSSKNISRRSTAHINLDLFQFIENSIHRTYFQYNLMIQNFYIKLDSSNSIFNIIEKNTLLKIKSLHNQSTALSVVIILLVIFTLLLINC